MKAALAGKTVLVVEDEYLLATLLKEVLEDLGAEVLGPFAKVEPALSALREHGMPAAALLDVNLGSEDSFPVVDELTRHGIQAVLLTGYDGMALPDPYRGLPRLHKPVDLATLQRQFVPLAQAAVGPGPKAGADPVH